MASFSLPAGSGGITSGPGRGKRAPMRIMAIDYGDAHTGIAISDPTGFLTGFTTTITAYRPELVAEQIAALERRTTIDAHQILFNAGKNGRQRKKTVDAVAASLILEGYLTYKKSQQR